MTRKTAMRLTLRTMLAYLDEILEPDDAADIGKKIEESEFATNLMHRTRDCIRRLRLGAPPLLGKGMALDPNTVAEYIDNELAAERVPDFEKVCLESDVHLAEVASCHQILSLVLDKRADVDPVSRDRMYQLVQSSKTPEAPPVAADVVTAPPVAAAPAPAAVGTVQLAAKRSKPEVPDYLREKRSYFWPVITVVLAAVATAGVLFLLVSQEGKNYVASLFGNAAPPAESGPATTNGNKIPEESIGKSGGNAATSESESKGSTEASNEQPEETDNAVGKSGKANLEIPKPTRVAPDDGSAPPAPEPGQQPVLKPATEPATSQPAAVGTVPAPTGGSPVGANVPQPGTPDPTVPRPSPAVPKPVQPPAVETPAAALEGVGLYVSAQDVLLRFNRAENGWRRLASKANVMAGDVLVALPTFSPTINLSNGVVVQPIGPAMIELQGADDRGVPGVVIGYGRVLMMTVAKGAQVRLVLGERTGMAGFGDAQSTLALELRRVLPLSKDPESSPALMAAELFATSGKIQWLDASGETIVQAPGRKVIAASPGFELPTETELPKWIANEPPSDLDKRASVEIERLMTTDRPVSLGLKELTESRRLEVRSLAIRSSAYVGQFDPFVAALNDDLQRANWTTHIDALRAAMARGPEVAAQVRATFEKQRGEEGRELYRMLWGYTVDDLKNEGAKLVRYLDHEALDFRELAIWNLQNATGMTLAYKAYDPPAKRRTSVMKWKEKLAEGKLVPAAPAVPAKPGAVKPAAPAPSEGTPN